MCLQCEVTDETNIISSASKMCIYTNVANPVHQIFNVESPLTQVCNGNIFIVIIIIMIRLPTILHTKCHGICIISCALYSKVTCLNPALEYHKHEKLWNHVGFNWLLFDLCVRFYLTRHTLAFRMGVRFFIYFFKESLNCDEHHGEHM